jgi:uncharacterized OsmC-like protein
VPEDHLGLVGKTDATASDDRAPENRTATRTLRCRTEATGRFTHQHHVRDLPPFGISTEVVTLLEDDATPSPAELLLAALGSCLSTSIHAGAVAKSIPIRRLEIELQGDVDFGSLWGTAGPLQKSPGFDAIGIIVHIDADAPLQTLKALIDHAMLWSPVGNTLHDPVHIDISLADRSSLKIS